MWSIIRKLLLSRTATNEESYKNQKLIIIPKFGLVQFLPQNSFPLSFVSARVYQTLKFNKNAPLWLQLKYIKANNEQIVR